jgi:hypothetical protein
MEARHGALAADVADFFALWHGHRGDSSRSSAWSDVAEVIQRRALERLLD